MARRRELRPAFRQHRQDDLAVRAADQRRRQYRADTLAGRRVCRVCGCDDDHACQLANGRPCSWVTPNLCNGCMRHPYHDGDDE